MMIKNALFFKNSNTYYTLFEMNLSVLFVVFHVG